MHTEPSMYYKGSQLNKSLPKLLLSSSPPKSLIYSLQECVEGLLNNSVHVVVARSLPWGGIFMHIEYLGGGVDMGLIGVVSLSWLEVEDGRVKRPVG